MSTSEERAARYSDLFEGAHDEHTSDCAYCPICATIAVVRKTRPEVMDHLAVAAREMIIAAGIMLEEAESFVGSSRTDAEKPDDGDANEPRVRHIDIG
ncbi:MAG: hypothetical protein ACRDKF_05520 [Actinomycetota bacterium]